MREALAAAALDHDAVARLERFPANVGVEL
jgi:hypothetical protein